MNIAYDDFYDLLDNDYDLVSTITPSSASISIASGSSTTITAASDADGAGGYVYGYILDRTKATVVQSAFGKNASFTVTGVAAGNTSLRLFTGSGEIVDVPVTIS